MDQKIKERITRRHSAVADDQRQHFQRDRDRILYSSAFRRLAGVTQIVRAGEADVFHTRQQHTIKVAQVGRRLAEKCIEDSPQLAERIGLHPEVVEAACLAHDLGHPPFGHIGEYELNKLVQADKNVDGFEGNAQTFRIITKLAVRFDECFGLDLTRATLAATLKYPWTRDPDDLSRSKKWNVYRTEMDDFTFAKGNTKNSAKTPEADLMDWADDIAYSVHDLEDFHRCGLIPWHRILAGDQSEQVIQRAKDSWFGAPLDADGQLRSALRNLNEFVRGGFGVVISELYTGERHQRQQIRNLTSNLIGRYVRAASLHDPDENGKCVAISQEEFVEVLVLKQITRDYIINNPSLAAQQKGQQRIIRDLFEDIHQDACHALPRYLPARLRYLWDIDDDRCIARFAADCVASLTEAEAVALHRRLRGAVSGSVLDPIVR